MKPIFVFSFLCIIGCSGVPNPQDVTDYEGVSETCKRGTAEQVYRMIDALQERFDVSVVEVGDTCEIPDEDSGETQVFSKGENLLFTICPLGTNNRAFVVREIEPIDWFSGILRKQWIVNIAFPRKSV